MEPLHINVLTWDAVEESVEANPLYLPLAGGKVKKNKSGKNRLIVSVAANPKTSEDVFGKGPYTHI